MNKFCKFTYFIIDYVKEAMLCITMVEVADALLINHTKCHIIIIAAVGATHLMQLS